MNIAIAGLGYVGLSLACLLSKHNEVTAIDIDEQRVASINNGASPIKDPDIEPYLASMPESLTATTAAEAAYGKAECIIIATPTNYDDETHQFDTSSIEAVLDQIASSGTSADVVIKSTIPVGYTVAISDRYPDLQIMFSPEFLREGHALHDNLHPSRIIVGITRQEDAPHAAQFAELLREGSLDPNVPTSVTGSTEAEAIKLFANTYLALRVSFFNELDTYAASKGLDSRQIIEGVCLDPRIGNHYNNPSFGYGGYCLPKDSKQLLANYEDVPQNLIRAIVDSNATRKDFIAEQIIDMKPKTVGAYRLIMKAGSDNFRQNAMLDVIDRLRRAGIKVLIYEPALTLREFRGCPVINSLNEFKESSQVILTNRLDSNLKDIKDKVYTRDIWGRD